MTTWTSISNAALAVGAIPSSAIVTAMRDNPIAIAEGASGAPIVETGWHPVGKLTVGDATSSLIYDFAVNGVVANVVTPDFTDGYEYRLLIDRISHNDGVTSRGLFVELFLETSGTYNAAIDKGGVSSAQTVSAHVDILMPRLDSQDHWVLFGYRTTASSDNAEMGIVSSSAQKILRARVRFSAGSIDAGRIWLFRRREYASSP